MAAALRGRRAAWILAAHEIRTGDDGPVAGGGPPSAPASRLTPAVLFITVVLTVVLLVSGLLHVLRQLFLKTHRANARAEAVERQLQQLFHLHEDGAGPGLDQAEIDALPAFAYRELGAAAGAAARGEKPFDCAVCLCEFDDDDRLLLLPLCGHAFHADCIDTWLRSSSTCPLCRAALSARALAAPAVAGDASVVEPDIEEQKPEQEAPDETASSVVLPVRLGRFKNTQGTAGAAEESSSCLDARRCYSMGSYQYVLADDTLLISVHWRDGDGSSSRRSAAAARANNVATARSDDQQGKKVYGRGDSFSMSKIWQWRGGDRRLPGLRADASPPADDGLPWSTTARTCTRQESDT